MATLLTGVALTLHVSQRLEAYFDYLQKLPAGTKGTTNLEMSVAELYAHILKFLTKAIRAYNSRNKSVLKQAFTSFWKKAELEEFEPQCEKLMSGIQRDASICDRELAAKDRDHARQLLDMLEKQIHDIEGIKDLLQELNTRMGVAKLPIAEGAVYGSHDDEYLSHCLEGTREELITLVTTWMSDPGSKTIFWLCGMAGTGKSTISRSIAATCIQNQHQGDILTASFFFQRGAGDRANANRLFSTIAMQLANADPSIRLSIANAVAAEPMLYSARFKQQCTKLLLEPLQDLDRCLAVPITVVILIDALDECDNQDDVKMVITLLMLIAQSTTFDRLTIRIFLTSRPETTIQRKFYDPSNKDLHQDIQLEYVQADTIKRDISKYLNHRLVEIRNDAELPSDWPSKDKIEVLVNLACPLFIFAATVCRWISDTSVLGSHPRKRLESLLQQRKDKALKGLDEMYRIILEQVFPSNTVENKDEYNEAITEFRQLLSPIILMADPLPLVPLSSLLGLTSSDMFSTLKQLQSVLQVPISLSEATPIQPLHASFADYLLKSSRIDNNFHIDEAQTHTMLAKKCLERLCARDPLRQNICNIDQPGTRRKEVLRERVADHVPPEVAYSCCYWVHHTANSRCKELLDDGGVVHMFLQSHFLHWLEGLSWLGRLSHAISYLDQLRNLIGVKFEHVEVGSVQAESRDQTHVNSQLLAFLDHAYRFVLQNRYVIDLAPLQLYYSALRFAPKQSIIREWFKGVVQQPEDLEFLHSPALPWSAEYQTLEAHSDSVTSVTFSPDGSLLATASWDKSIRLWDSRSGEEKHVFDTESSTGRLVFSLDGQMLGAGFYSYSEEKQWTVRLWNVQTGEHTRTFQGNGGHMHLIFFSSDEVIGALDSGQRLMNLTTGVIHSLEVPPYPIQAVAFSADGQIMVRATQDTTVQLCETQSGKEIKALPGYDRYFNTLTFSPGGRKVLWVTSYSSSRLSKNIYPPGLASGAHDTRESDAYSGGFINSDEDSPGEVSAVAYSPTGHAVKLIYENNRLGLWKSACNEVLELVQDFIGHEDLVIATAFASSSDYIISASRDSTIRLWNPWTGEELHRATYLEDNVVAIAFGSLSRTIALARGDHTIILRALESGRDLATWSAHEANIHAVSFSLDNQSLVSTSADYSIRIWDVATGKELHKFILDEKWANATFSPDGREIFSVSGNGKLRRWDIDTGKSSNDARYGFIHKNISSLALSPDNRTIAFVWREKLIRLLNATTGRETQRLHEPGAEIDAVTFSPDGHLLATGSRDVNVYLWDVRAGTKIQCFVGHTSFVFAVAFSPNGRMLASCSSDNTVRLWNTQSRNEKQEDEHPECVSELLFSPNGRVLAEVRQWRSIRLWDPFTAEVLHTLEIPDTFTCMTFSADGSKLASSSSGGLVQLWEIRTGRLLLNFESHQRLINKIAFLSDGERIATTSSGETIQFWNVHKGKLELTIKETLSDKNDYIRSVAFSPDGRLVATSVFSSIIKIRDTRTGQGIQEIGGEPAWFTGLYFSPDGLTLATTNHNGSVICWNVQTGGVTMQLRLNEPRETPPAPRHDRPIAFTRSGDMVACAAHEDDVLYLWNTQSRVEILRIDVGAWVKNIEFSADGQLLHTEIGTFELHITNTTSSKGNSATRTSPELKGQWLRYRGRDLLWLPQEYRDVRAAVQSCVAVFGNTMVAGKHSAALAFFRVREPAAT